MCSKIRDTIKTEDPKILNEEMVTDYNILRKVRGCEASVVVYHVDEESFNYLEIITRARKKIVFIVDQMDRDKLAKQAFIELLKDAERENLLEQTKVVDENNKLLPA